MRCWLNFSSVNRSIVEFDFAFVFTFVCLSRFIFCHLLVNVHSNVDMVVSLHVSDEKFIVDDLCCDKLLSDFLIAHVISFSVSVFFGVSLFLSSIFLSSLFVFPLVVVFGFSLNFDLRLFSRLLLDWLFMDGHLRLLLLDILGNNRGSVVGEQKLVLFVEQRTVIERNLSDARMSSVDVRVDTAVTSVTIESAARDDTTVSRTTTVRSTKAKTTVATATRSERKATLEMARASLDCELGSDISAARSLLDDLDNLLGTAIGGRLLDYLDDLDFRLNNAIWERFTMAMRTSVATTLRDTVATTTRSAVSTAKRTWAVSRADGTWAVSTAATWTVSGADGAWTVSGADGAWAISMAARTWTVAWTTNATAIARAAIGSTVTSASLGKLFAVNLAVSFAGMVTADSVKSSVKITTNSMTMTITSSASAAEKTLSLETFTAGGTNEAATMSDRFAESSIERAKLGADTLDIVVHWAAHWGNSWSSIAVTWAATTVTWAATTVTWAAMTVAWAATTVTWARAVTWARTVAWARAVSTASAFSINLISVDG